MLAIAIFFVAHWALSVFAQSFFLHRYSAHRMFTLSKGWERFFYAMTWVCQGSSFLSPRAYALLHREHHAFSDTERDPHSPHFHKNFGAMMLATKIRYYGLLTGEIRTEPRFEGGYPTWPALDRLADSWVSRIGFGAAYTLFYIAFAPHWAFFLLLPAHFLMGPIHGAIVNWGGHKYGYRNFDTKDLSRNTLPLELLTGGELFQNNHHKFGMSPNFAVRWFEVDPTYQVMRVLHVLRIIDMTGAQNSHWTRRDREQQERVILAATKL
jgi:stearoyl-CoA desaturase (delta-9 desaturase)